MTSEVPIIYGTYPLQGDAARAAVELAIDLGYRRVDTAQWYGNEAAVGAAITASGRSDIFVQTKVLPVNATAARLIRSVERSLADLRVDAVDLLFLHWPPREPAIFDDAIRQLSACVERGYARTIGVSNCTAALVRRAVSVSKAPIVAHQLEYHPFLDQSVAEAVAAENGIALQGYAPLGQGRLTDDAAVIGLAAAQGITPAQLILRWVVQRGVVPVCKAASRANAAANLAVLDLALPAEAMVRMASWRSAALRTVALPELAPDWDGVAG